MIVSIMIFLIYKFILIVFIILLDFLTKLVYIRSVPKF